MSAYDLAIESVPLATSNKFHRIMSDPALCAIKISAQSDNILSENSKSILRDFASNRPIEGEGNLPDRLTVQQGRAIRDELLINRHHMLANIRRER